MGRPRKSISEQRNDRVGVRFTAAELSLLEAQALAAGTTVTDLVRRRALRLPVTPPRIAQGRGAANAALVNELNRIGVNLNQIAHATHRGAAEKPHWVKLARELSRVLEKLVVRRDS